MIQPAEDCAVVVPRDFPVINLGEFGQLFVMAPAQEMLVALKLVRGKPHDIEDAKWLATHRGLTEDDIRAAIATLPKPNGRDAAPENLGRMKMPSA